MALFDVIFAGGGLSTGLMAVSLRKARPELRILIVERGAKLGGDHTWSFHGSDLTNGQLAALTPMIRSSWTAQDVRFPQLNRTLETPYCTIISSDFDSHVQKVVGPQSLMLNASIEDVSKNAVVLSGGQRLEAPCVIDGRGWQPSSGRDLALAYQKFFGLEVELKEPHGLTRPIIMDATIDQTDGYRFMYCLPYTATNLLIEDTYYSPSMGLDAARAARAIEAYAETHGWQIASIGREEKGCLPIVLAGEATAFDVSPQDAAPCGLRAGLFHPTTGYSLPDAVRVADQFAEMSPLTTDKVKAELKRHNERLWRDRGFYRLLNRLLFVGAQNYDRRKVMQRFYRLPHRLIERFYAGQSTQLDRLRVLSGKPPIPITVGMRVIPAQAAWDYVRAQ